MRQYIVDAFTDKVFSGNPAAVCVTEEWLPCELMQKIAVENNLSETAFAVKEKGGYGLRWFAPGGEVGLCGHATLACAYVISNFYDKGAGAISFHTKSGVLTVKNNGGLYEMEFPAFKLEKISVTEEITAALGTAPREAYIGRDLLCVFDDEKIIREMKPDLERVAKLPGALINVTAPGGDFECISRSFAPKYGIAEDPVCGSGHCHIIPYWAGRLCREKLTAYQASRRGGVLHCQMKGDRVILGGKAVLFAVSDILPEGGFTG